MSCPVIHKVSGEACPVQHDGGAKATPEHADAEVVSKLDKVGQERGRAD
jgi:hypothetical protein